MAVTAESSAVIEDLAVDCSLGNSPFDVGGGSALTLRRVTLDGCQELIARLDGELLVEDVDLPDADPFEAGAGQGTLFEVSEFGTLTLRNVNIERPLFFAAPLIQSFGGDVTLDTVEVRDGEDFYNDYIRDDGTHDCDRGHPLECGSLLGMYGGTATIRSLGITHNDITSPTPAACSTPKTAR